MTLYLLRRRLSLLLSFPYSLYFCFHYLPFKQAIRVPVILYNPTFWALKGKVIIDAPNVCFGMIRLGLFNASVNNAKGFVWMNEGGTVIFHGRFAVGAGSCIKVSQRKAVLEIGDDVINASALKIDCSCRIKLNNRILLGWETILMDSNLHRLKKADGSWDSRGYNAVEIGENSWISSRCVVLPGTKFPSYSVCALGTVLNKDYSPEGRGLYAGKPATLKKAGIWYDMSDNKIDYDEI